MSDLGIILGPRRKAVEIVGVASGVGARNLGCAAGPDLIRAHWHSHSRTVAPWRETIRLPTANLDHPFEKVRRVCRRLAKRTQAIIDHGGFPVIVAADHSSAIGTWKGAAWAMRERGPLGLIWIDAHMDAHTPQTSASGALHGMPLACLLGHGDTRLTSICDSIALQAQHICVIGVRSYETAEELLLRRLGVRIYYMTEVARRGLDMVVREALETVTKGTAGFGITIDLDALDPGDVAGVNTPVDNGIRTPELALALEGLSAHPQLVAIEVAEYNPDRDHDGRTADTVVQLLDAALSRPRQSAGMTSLIELENRYGAHHYAPLPVLLVRGEGAYLWDSGGRRYLDMMSAYSAVSHGHCHPRIVSALAGQAQRLAVTSRAYYNDQLPVFLKRLCEISGQDLAMPLNTGLEAVEAAIKASRKWGHQVKGIPNGRAEIIACAGNFHGRSITILAMSSEPQYRRGFEPFPTGFKSIPYGDASALERAITSETAAFIVEPIQGEAGIIVPPKGYLAQCAEICKRHNVLLICDEVQTGLGRTGRLFACEHDAVKPDGLILGKALGGGVLPVSAFLARRDVMEVFTPGDHGSTFGGNALAAAVGLAAIEVLFDEGLVERAATLGDYLMQELHGIKSPLIREIRGKGLLVGVDINPSIATARAVCERLLYNGVLSKDTHQTVVRLAPPLVITRKQLDSALAALRTTLGELETVVRHAA